MLLQSLKIESVDDLRTSLASKSQLTDWCRRWHVCELAVFGSLTTGVLTSTSDIDMIVRFEDGCRPGLFGLLTAESELANIVGRPVDLLDRDAIESDDNHLRRNHLLSSAKVVYGHAA